MLKLKRMRVGYFAMTRPTHAVCLALPARSLGTEIQRAQNLTRLEERGWTIEDLSS